MKTADIPVGEFMAVKPPYGGSPVKAKVKEVGVTRRLGAAHTQVRRDGVLVVPEDDVAQFGQAIKAGTDWVVASRDVVAPWSEGHERVRASRAEDRERQEISRRRLAAVGIIDSETHASRERSAGRGIGASLVGDGPPRAKVGLQTVEMSHASLEALLDRALTDGEVALTLGVFRDARLKACGAYGEGVEERTAEADALVASLEALLDLEMVVDAEVVE